MTQGEHVNPDLSEAGAWSSEAAMLTSDTERRDLCRCRSRFEIPRNYLLLSVKCQGK